MAKRYNTPGQAYGDIFLVQTPVLDRWGQQLYAEQKIAEQRRAQENQGLDAMIQREVGKVRSVDTPDVIKAYQDYKGLKQKILFDKQLQKDPLAYNQMQQAAQQAYRNIFTIANGSAEMKDFQKQQAAGYAKNPNAYDDNAGTILSAAMNTPYSQLRNHPVFGDLTNPNTYAYKGANTNWSEHVQKAIGQSKKILGTETLTDGGLTYKTPVFEYANNSKQVKDYLIGVMATHQAGRDAAYQWDHTPEKEIEETIKAVQAIPKESFERTGMNGPEDLYSKNPDSKAENFASFLAMKDFLSRQPREIAPLTRENRQAVMAAQEAKEKRMQALRHMNAKDLIDYKKKIDPNDDEMNNVWYQSYLDKRIDEAISDGQRHHVFTDKGRSILYYKEIKPDPFLMKALMRGKSEPDRVGLTEDGQIIPIFFKYKSEKEGGGIEKLPSGAPVIDEDYSKPMSYDQALVNLGYRGATKKQLKEDQGKIQAKQKPSAGKPKKVIQNGHEYILNEMTGQYE